VAQPKSQMYETTLEELRGGASNVHKIDFTARWGTIDATSKAQAGRVCHRDGTTGLLALGAVGNQVPLIVRQNIDSADMSNPGAFTNPSGDFTAIEPTGGASGPVTTGAFELFTTAYDLTDDWAAAYNAPLHSPTEGQITGSDKSKAGLVYRKKNWPGGNNSDIAVYTDNVLGFVSQGIIKTLNRQKGLAFYAHFLPGSGPTT